MLGAVKALIKGMPVIGPHLLDLRRGSFTGSVDYWERRYSAGGNSGFGSYGRLAEYKADFLNRFVTAHEISSVIEHGCGDGAQLELANYPTYIGIDISPTALAMCKERFAEDGSKHFLQPDAVPEGTKADLAISLDVIYHLVEDSVFEAYMRQMLQSAGRFAIIYSSNMDREWPERHIRHRQFTRWIAQNKPEWSVRAVSENPYPYDPADEANTSFADFYVFGRSS
jgi:cyclopropane fatty-acyl-phospholipid synthase-like methyltransferase